MPTITSNLYFLKIIKLVSAEIGPKTFIPFFFAIFIDGKITNNYLADVKTTQAETTPVTISLKGSSFDNLTVNVKVTISSDTDLSADPLYLFVMATIDSVYYAGRNGETDHEQTFLGYIGDTNIDTTRGDTAVATAEAVGVRQTSRATLVGGREDGLDS